MRKPNKATTMPPRQRPGEGGSYVRLPDGGLEREAQPATTPEPPAPAVVPATGGDEQ